MLHVVDKKVSIIVSQEVITLKMLLGIETMQIKVPIQLERNFQMNWIYMICAVMYGSGQKLQPIHIQLMLSLKAIALSVVAEVGGIKKRIVVCLEDMPLIIQKRQVD